MVCAKIITINYSVSNSCGTSTVSHSMTVDPLPTTPAAITGAAAVCIGSSATLSDVTSGGAWSSSNTLVATVGSTGSVSGIATGPATISYTLTNGCGSSSVTDVIAVDSTPVVLGNNGCSILCANAAATFSDITGGGSWSSSNTATATVNGGGIVTGLQPGTLLLPIQLQMFASSTHGHHGCNNKSAACNPGSNNRHINGMYGNNYHFRRRAERRHMEQRQ